MKKCICNNKLKVSEKSGKLLKTCGNKKCIEDLRNEGFKKKLQGEVNKKFIQEKLITKTGKLNPNLTKLLHQTIEEIYCIYYSIDKQYCNCGKKKTFLTFQTGYRQTCGTSNCSNNISGKLVKEKATKLERYGDENYNNKEKISITNIKKYGFSTFLASPQGQKIRRIPLLRKGFIKTEEQKSDYEKYKKKIIYLTEKQPLHLLKHIEKRSVTGYHLDHKFSISEGFKNNILPIYIANINNLEMIDGILNRQKATKCSISEKELSLN